MSREEEKEEEELLQLEEEVDSIAQRILDYRTTFPHKLNSTLSSFLQLPQSQNPTPGEGLLGIAELGTMDLAVTGAEEEAVKIRLLKEKIANNACMMPVVLKRMKQYIARTENLETTNGAIHPAFKRKKTTK